MKIKDGNILEVRDLTVKFAIEEGTVNAVNGVNFFIPKGKSIGIVGESGCGKTVTSYSVTRLLPKTARVSGEIIYRQSDGNVINIADLPAEGAQIRRIRGREIAMIFQEPMTSLSPVHTILDQISEGIILFQNLTQRQARQRTVELLKLVGIPNSEKRLQDYPFQFSGGMRQRVMIAMALARNPRILIADEPTTALDVTLQAQVLSLIQDMQREFDLSLVLITHDLGVVAHMVDFIFIMYLGRVIESGPLLGIFDNPLHPYTKGLLNSIPKLRGKRGERVQSIPGSVPNAFKLPPGCAFAARCPHRMSVCQSELPPRVEADQEHHVSCFLYEGGKEESHVRNVQ